MGSNGSSEHHQNNNLKVVIAIGNFIGKDYSFLDITKNTNIRISWYENNKLWWRSWQKMDNNLEQLSQSVKVIL